MKPPPRTRNKPARDMKLESGPRRPGKLMWQRTEQRKLLNGLKALRRTVDANSEIDYAFLRKYVPNRSISEVHSVVESLKDKVITGASFELKKKRWEEKKVRKPIELWTHMASAVAGTLEERISTAFSQMLIVSSTEPRTLRNCDPPKVHIPLTDRPVGCTVPLRTMPCLPVQGERPGINTAQSVKTPAATVGPVVSVPNSKITPPQHRLCTTAGTSPAATSTPQSAVTSCQAGAEKELDAPFTSPQPTSQTVTPVRGQVKPSSITAAEGKTTSSSSSVSSSPETPLASSATTKDVKCVVDFERIYSYLSVIHKPNEECHLTPMESAIVLDLLMSLPEELPLLDCNKLHKHLVQVYQCLSSPADSKTAREMFKDLKDGQTEAPNSQDSNTANSQQNAAGTADSCDVTELSQAQSQSSGNNKTSSQSGDTGVTAVCAPLNPFMIPLKLLMRR